MNFTTYRQQAIGVLQQFHEENTAHSLDEQGVPSYVSTHPVVKFMFWRRLQITARAVLNGPRKTILDFGCGAGAFLPFLSANAKTVYAYDQDARALSCARQLVQSLGMNNVWFLDLESLSSNSLDAIVALDVLEHVDNLPELLKVFTEKLTPEGRLIVSSPTEYWYYKLARKFAPAGYQGEYHVRAADDVEAEMRKCFKLKVVGRVFPVFQFFRIAEAKK